MIISEQNASYFAKVTEATRAQIDTLLKEKATEGFKLEYDLGFQDVTPDTVEIGCGTFLCTPSGSNILVYCHHWSLTLDNGGLFPETCHFYLGLEGDPADSAPSYTAEKVQERIDNLYFF